MFQLYKLHSVNRCRWPSVVGI